MLSEEESASHLARRPYDLRHAGVSFWLSSGVDPMECARRAGHTIAVLFRVYAKVLARTQERANRQVDAAMREWNNPGPRGMSGGHALVGAGVRVGSGGTRGCFGRLARFRRGNEKTPSDLL